MAFTVVLDTCVLYSAHLRDSLLRLAESGLYQAQWSEDILAELSRSLIKAGVSSHSVEHLLTQMQQAFPNAQVRGYKRLIPTMDCNDKDRHVLATAVRADASAIVTFNTRDFPKESTDPYEVDIIHPDAFLLDLLDLSPRMALSTLVNQAESNRREPNSVPALLDALARAGVPRFAAEARYRLT